MDGCFQSPAASFHYVVCIGSEFRVAGRQTHCLIQRLTPPQRRGAGGINNKNLCFHSFIMSIEVVRRKLCCGSTCAPKPRKCCSVSNICAQLLLMSLQPLMMIVVVAVVCTCVHKCVRDWVFVHPISSSSTANFLFFPRAGTNCCPSLRITSSSTPSFLSPSLLSQPSAQGSAPSVSQFRAR